VILKVGTLNGTELQIDGDECLSLGHKVSAREAYLRASSYYRTAEFFLHENPEDPRIVKTDSFNKAAKLFPHYFESLEIPYDF
jgi:hypothetical protein